VRWGRRPPAGLASGARSCNSNHRASDELGGELRQVLLLAPFALGDMRDHGLLLSRRELVASTRHESRDVPARSLLFRRALEQEILLLEAFARAVQQRFNR